MGSTQRYVALDALRGVAALLVISRHVEDKTLVHLIPHSELAVDFFFALSGFVIAHAYGQKLASGMSIGGFMRARAIRLWPLYALGTVLGALVMLPQIDSPAYFGALLVLGLSFVPLVFTPIGTVHNYPLNYPGWSIFWELAVNAVYALIARFLSNALLGAIVAVGAVLAVLSATKFGFGGSLQEDFLAGGGRVLYAFFMGVAVYRLHQRFPAPQVPWWALAVAVVLCMALPAPLFTSMVVMPLIVWLGAGASVKGAALATALGNASYGFYILQAPVIEVMQDVGFGGPAGTLLMVGVVFALALLADRFFDAPLRKLLSRIVPKPPAFLSKRAAIAQ